MKHTVQLIAVILAFWPLLVIYLEWKKNAEKYGRAFALKQLRNVGVGAGIVLCVILLASASLTFTD